jgi:GR25 family glycosyltransferase involved in LPS biosynthesis
MYNYFDSIVCISLYEAVERQQQCVNNFKKLGIKNYEFYKTQRHKEGGRFGCFMSHINVIENEYHKGSENVLIFEDDFMPSSSYNENVIQEVIDFIDDQQRNWDIMYLGHCVISYDVNSYIPKKITNNIYKMKPFCTQALILSRKGMIKILKEASIYLEKTIPKNVIHYDKFLSNILTETYCVLPMQFVQNMCTESYNSKDMPLIEKILRSVPVFMKHTGLSKTCDASYGLSLLIHHNIIIVCVIMLLMITVKEFLIIR